MDGRNCPGESVYSMVISESFYICGLAQDHLVTLWILMAEIVWVSRFTEVTPQISGLA